jgi:hypothetical protein
MTVDTNQPKPPYLNTSQKPALKYHDKAKKKKSKQKKSGAHAHIRRLVQAEPALKYMHGKKKKEKERKMFNVFG